jgi:CRISPR-associated protein Cmr4
LVFTDAKLVCLPIRSLYGTFAWCCSKISLKRIKRDLDLAQIKTNGLDKINNLQDLNPQAVMVTSTTKLKNEGKVYLEDLDLNIQDQTEIDDIAQFLADKIFTNKEDKDMFKERFAIVSEDVFNFLCETGTEVIAHNKIDDKTKVTVKGALWYEETLPAETILFGFVWQQLTVKDKDKNEISLENAFCKSDKPVNLQLGGKSSVGKGQIICNFVKE